MYEDIRDRGFWIAMWLLFNVLLVGVYDIYAYFCLPEQDTVSFWVQKWFREMPVLALVVGLLLGHLAWPLSVKKGE